MLFGIVLSGLSDFAVRIFYLNLKKYEEFMKRILCLVLLTSFLFTTGCSNRKNHSPLPTISEEAQTELKKPVDCSTASQDIAILEEEKASVGKRMLSGVRSVFPIAAVAGILMGDYGDRVSVAAGTYNDDIEAKIKEIKTVCEIQ
jgi:hypothetical protein